MHAVTTIALLCNFVGVVLMVRYGLPNNLPLLGRAPSEMSVADFSEQDRRSLVGVVGLVLFALGNCVLIANAWTAA